MKGSEYYKTTMKRYYYISALIVVMFLCQCSSVKNIAGTYTKRHAYVTITLNEDHTFSYRYKFEFAEMRSAGIWKMTGKREVTLNSKVKSRKLAMNIRDIERVKNDTATLTINLLHMPDSEKKYYKCSIFINGQFYISNPCDSIYRIPVPLPVSSILLGISGDKKIPNRFVDTLFTEKKKNISPYANLQLDVNYVDSFFNYRIFDNKLIKVAHGHLKLHTRRNNQITLIKQ